MEYLFQFFQVEIGGKKAHYQISVIDKLVLFTILHCYHFSLAEIFTLLAIGFFKQFLGTKFSFPDILPQSEFFFLRSLIKNSQNWPSVREHITTIRIQKCSSFGFRLSSSFVHGNFLEKQNVLFFV